MYSLPMIDFYAFNYNDVQKQVVNTSDGIVNSKERSNTYPDGFNLNPLMISQKILDTKALHQ